MTISQAEELKRDWTDKYVVVQSGVAELRRFQGLTGTVKTVNMSGRALVEFDGPVDIGWYDIDPAYLQRVDQPLPKQAAGHDAKGHAAKGAAKAVPAAAPAAKGASPLDQIRQQGAAKADAPAAPAGKLSPLDLIRQQGAAKAAPAGEPAAEEPAPVAEAAPAPAPAAAPAAPPAGMSPLDLIRQQGAAKR